MAWKRPHPRTVRRKKEKKEWPGEAYVGLIALGFVGYFFGEILLYPYPHPVHWSAALAGAGLGAGLGILWARRPWGRRSRGGRKS